MTHLPEPINFTGIQSVLLYVNTVGEGWTFAIFLIVMHIVFFAFMKQKGNGMFESLLSTSYIMMIAVGISFAMGVVPTVFALFYGSLLGFIILGYLATKK